MDTSADVAALHHDLNNLTLHSSETSDVAPAALHTIKSAAQPTLAGMDHVLETLREVNCRIFSLNNRATAVAVNLLTSISNANYLNKTHIYMQVIGWPVLYAKEAATLGVNWPRGVLLHGPSGTGKSSAVAAIAAEFNAIVHVVTTGSIIGAFVGESERRLREVFSVADNDAETSGRPVIIFLDDVDSLCPRRAPGQQHEARLVGQLLTLLDGADRKQPPPPPPPPFDDGQNGDEKIEESGAGKGFRGHVVIIAATSRPNALDPALRRPGRLDREVAMPVPSPAARAAILHSLVARFPGINSVELDVDTVANQCHGYTGADLEALCREATMKAFSEHLRWENENMSVTNSSSSSTTTSSQSPLEEDLVVTTQDFLDAMQQVGASLARSVVKDFSPAAWDDIGGLEETKKRLKQAVEWPITKADAFKRLGIRSPRGVLLHGPPGCAKTTLARAAATSSKATFIPLQGASLYSMFVGEGEAELREAFRKARLTAPSIIFVDELDMLVGKRGSSSSSTDDTSARLLSTFLNEMDGLELAGGVLVLATTNRPAAIDGALLRPGRFDSCLYVPPPDCAGRLAALHVHTRKIPLSVDVDLQAVAGSTERYTGAELAAVCSEAVMAALREDVEGVEVVEMRHFEAALKGVRAALSEEVLESYAAWPPRK